MGDFGIRTPEAFDELNVSTRLSPELFFKPIAVDTDVYYLLRLGHEEVGGKLIGGVSLAQRSLHVPPDIGWCVLEEFQRNGYATEAAKELLRMVREVLGITEVITWPGKHNEPSQKVAKRVGFVESGLTIDETGEEVVVYVLPGMNFDGTQAQTLSLYGQ